MSLSIASCTQLTAPQVMANLYPYSTVGMVTMRLPNSAHPETMKTTTTLLDEVLSEFVVNVFNRWLRRDFLHRIAWIAEDSA